jgi:hypothetical protein
MADHESQNSKMNNNNNNNNLLLYTLSLPMCVFFSKMPIWRELLVWLALTKFTGPFLIGKG